MLNDLRYAVRSLSRSRSFVVLVVMSLALALGLNTTVYAIVDAVTHPYQPYREPDRLYRVLMYGDAQQRLVSLLERFHLIRTGSHFFEDIALGTSGGAAVIETGGDGVNGSVSRVTSNYFTMLGVPPAVGRMFAADGSDGESAVVISHALWQRLFPGLERLDGVAVTINGQPHSVIGVAPRELGNRSLTAWVVISPGAMGTGRTIGRFSTMVRLRRAVSDSVARSSLAVVAGQIGAAIRHARPAVRI